eukprot:SAG31_NODE_1004_length_10437_cov_2.754208_11_plen_110_part_00
MLFGLVYDQPISLILFGNCGLQQTFFLLLHQCFEIFYQLLFLYEFLFAFCTALSRVFPYVLEPAVLLANSVTVHRAVTFVLRATAAGAVHRVIECVGHVNARSLCRATT